MVRTRILAVVACLAALNLPMSGQRTPRDVTRDAGSTYTTVIKGEVRSCAEFKRRFGPDLVFALRPERDAFGGCVGWRIAVNLVNDDVDLAEMSNLPFGRGVLELFASMFAPGSSPTRSRLFDFSPEMKRLQSLIEHDADTDGRSGELLDSIKPFGTGLFVVQRYSVAPPSATSPNGRVLADAMRFEVTLWLPATYTGFSTEDR